MDTSPTCAVAGLAEAVARWREAIGSAAVLDDEVTCADAAATTFATSARVLAILRPADRAEVQACVRIAHTLHVPLHVISRGRNWGYGSRAPARDAVLLDLARLDRIVDFDERLAHVTVEPGVTFRQLATFLRDCRARVFASVTGGPADGSVLANALERGDGAGPLGDRFAHLCALEVVLPTGECVSTGFARLDAASVAPLHRWGVGPSLDGLFSQSALGIVTRATVWLTPYPEDFTLTSLVVDAPAALPAVIEALRRLRMTGVTPATTPLWNDIRALGLVTRYPWDEAGNTTPLPSSLRTAMRQRHGLGRWNGTLSLYGASRAHGAALREIVLDALGDLARVTFRAGPADPLDADPDACGPMLGVPHDRTVAGLYWRSRRPLGTDPDRDRCGFLWLAHALPFTGEAARAFDEIAETELTARGFEPGVALLGVTERVLSGIVAITYDRDVPDEDARARACHDHVCAQLLEAGFPPFRTGVASHRLVPHGDPTTAALVERLRVAIDPHAILSRG